MKKKYRVKKSQEFEKIIKYKRFFTDKNDKSIVLYIKEKNEDNSRVGITVKKKIGNAVVRNKVKRQVRMMVQEIYDFNENFDSILLIKEKFVENDYLTNKNTLERLYKKAKQVKIDK